MHLLRSAAVNVICTVGVYFLLAHSGALLAGLLSEGRQSQRSAAQRNAVWRTAAHSLHIRSSWRKGATDSSFLNLI